MTPNLQVLYDGVHSAFPDVGSMGVTNCRHIAGSASWSQHAWSNAWDITSPASMRVNGLSDEHYTYLDGVSAFVDQFEVRFKLWRRPNHYDHIHVDMWPYGYGTPPCVGGMLQTRWPDSTISSSWEAPMAHEHQRGPWFDGDGNPIVSPHAWAEDAWDAYLARGLSTVPDSVRWEMYREDQAYLYLKAIKPLEDEVAEIRALIQEPPSAPPSGGSGGGPSG
ncbi:MAG: hypothetical protein ACE5E8_02380, partial [Acidimicrobiia bacterium]